MRSEVHVHGSIFLCKGVRLKQVELALKPWLEYLEVDTLLEAKSVEQDEVGIHFDPRERTVNICWTGEVDAQFQEKLSISLQNIGPLSEYASEIEVIYYNELTDDEVFQVFVGPSPEAIQEFRRQCVIEDATDLLSRHLNKSAVDQVANLINELFVKEQSAKSSTTTDSSAPSSVIPLHPRNKHLH
jgi:hypothetical protein